MSLSYAPARWPSATSTVVLWSLAAASVVFWGLRLAAPAGVLPPPTLGSGSVAAPDAALLSTFLGSVSTTVTAAVAPAAASRFVLLGVVADRDQRGAALIAVDGKAAKPFRVGSQVEEGYVLQSVSTRAAQLGASVDSAAALTLELPVRPMAMPGAPR